MLFLRRKKPQGPKAPLPRRVHELEVITSRLIRAGFAGEYHAAFHGRGLEFAQVREYQPGDDVRTIDWNVTARSGVPHVKQFVEERDLTVILVADVSRSMQFGSVDRRKIDLASELMAILAFAAVQNGDRIGLLTFGPGPEGFIPPRRGRKHVQAVVRAALLAGGSAATGSSFDSAALFIERVLPKRSVVIFVSDFLDASFERPLRRLNEKHDVIAICITDPREERFPRMGIVLLEDSETGERISVDLARNDVERRSEMRVRGLADAFRRIGIDAVSLSTAVPYDRTLLRFFEQRIARLR